mgnify:FL=1
MSIEIIIVLLSLVAMLTALIMDKMRPGMILFSVVVLFLCTGILSPKEMLEGMIEKSGLKVKIVEGHIYDVMSVADLALATSGTVTLEAALCGLGCVIVYKTSPISAFIARRVINIPDIGLPNIVAGRHILPELLQEDFTPEKTAQEALHLLEPERNAQMKQDLEYVRERLGAPGAVNRVAELVLRVAKEKK